MERVVKGWGEEQIITNGPLYCGKRMLLLPGRRCSWHYHERKDETFYVEAGAMQLHYSTRDCMVAGKFGPGLAETITLSAGESFHVPVGLRHQFIGVGDQTCVFYEFSTEDFPEDSIRLEKGD